MMIFHCSEQHKLLTPHAQIAKGALTKNHTQICQDYLTTDSPRPWTRGVRFQITIHNPSLFCIAQQIALLVV